MERGGGIKRQGEKLLTHLHQVPRLRTIEAVPLLTLYGSGVERDKSYNLGSFAKLLKATISFVMFVRMEQSGSHWTVIHEI
jgi:hypothetical protein